jgi:hypothetical protein
VSTGPATLRFTLSEYRECLELAFSSGYRFAGFHESLTEPDSPVIFLRHDIDYAPRFIPAMAGLESDLGVRSTYCVQLASPWYGVDSGPNRAVIQSVVDQGHWLGLHFDASAIASDAEVPDRVVAEADRLGDQFGVPVRVVSFHNPGRRRIDHLELPDGFIHTYAPRFFTEIGYVSDSNQDWRGKDLRRILARREYVRLQLLIHPFWWREEPLTLGAKMEAMAAELGIPLEELAQPEHLAIMKLEAARQPSGQGPAQK